MEEKTEEVKEEVKKEEKELAITEFIKITFYPD